MKIKNGTAGQIDPRIDEYINSLLEEAKEYELSGRSKNILNYTIYLILNANFQYILRTMRLGLSMPIDGFENDNEIGLWKAKFREIVKRYHAKEIVEPETKIMIGEIEKKMGGALVYSEKKVHGILIIDMYDDAISIAAQFILEFLKFKNTKNVVYWLNILKKLLIFDSPAKVLIYLQNIGKTAGEQDVFIELQNNRIVITIVMYPDTTFKDLEQLIEVKRSKISKRLKEIRNSSRKNQSKTDDINRDYFIYRTYLDHKSTRMRGEDYYFNVTKADAVKKIAEKSVEKKETQKAKYLELGSIRKIVSRMNKRIKNTLPNSPTELNMFLGILAPKHRT